MIPGLAQAVVFDGHPNAIEFRHIAVPEPTGGEVLVRVLGCTICGSDVHTIEGRRAVPVPTILGHEIVGAIAAFGPDVPRVDRSGRGLSLGDRVCWSIVASCGVCQPCRSGLPQKCRSAVKYGHEPFRPGRELLGGMAEFCLLVPGTSMVRLPDDLPVEVACPASCATATIAAAMEAAGGVTGRSVCVFGAGLLGLTACAMARVAGAEIIACIEPDELRRGRAGSFGADRVGHPRDIGAIAIDTVGETGFDVVLELSGNPEALEAAGRLAAVGGSVVLVGSVFPGPPWVLDPERIIRRHLTIKGIHNYAPSHLSAAVSFLETHHRRFPFAGLVARWYPLEAANEALAHAGRAEAIRVGLAPAR